MFLQIVVGSSSGLGVLEATLWKLRTRVKITLTLRMVRTVRKTTIVMEMIQTEEGTEDEGVRFAREGEGRRGDLGENGDVWPPSRVTAMLTL